MDISTLLKLQEIERRKRMGERHKSIPIKKDHYGELREIELTVAKIKYGWGEEQQDYFDEEPLKGESND